jgi:hypothetical protein
VGNYVDTFVGDPVVDAQLKLVYVNSDDLENVRSRITNAAKVFHHNTTLALVRRSKNVELDSALAYEVSGLPRRLLFCDSTPVTFSIPTCDEMFVGLTLQPVHESREFRSLVETSIPSSRSPMTFHYGSGEEQTAGDSTRSSYEDFYDFLIYLGHTDLHKLELEIFDVDPSKIGFGGRYSDEGRIELLPIKDDIFRSFRNFAHEYGHDVFHQQNQGIDPEFGNKLVQLYGACLYGEGARRVPGLVGEFASVPTEYSVFNPNEFHSEVFGASISGMAAAKTVQHLVETNKVNDLLQVDFDSEHFWLFNQPEHIRAQVADLCNLNLEHVEELTSLIKNSKIAFAKQNKVIDKIRSAIKIPAIASNVVLYGSFAAFSANKVRGLTTSVTLSEAFPTVKSIVDFSSPRNLFIVGSIAAATSAIAFSKKIPRNIYAKIKARSNGATALLMPIKLQIAKSNTLRSSHKFQQPKVKSGVSPVR